MGDLLVSGRKNKRDNLFLCGAKKKRCSAKNGRVIWLYYTTYGKSGQFRMREEALTCEKKDARQDAARRADEGEQNKKWHIMTNIFILHHKNKT